MKNMRKIIALVLAIVMTFAMAGCSSDGIADDGTNTALIESINGAGKYLTKKITSPTYGDETAIIALNRSTYIDYWHNRSQLYISGVEHILRSNAGILGDGKVVYADGYDDTILAHTAVGIYADKASAAVLTQGISIDQVLMMGGTLNKVNALTALECGKYEMFEKGDLTRQDLIDFIMELWQADGSFRYKTMANDGVSPVKLTASAVTGLALSGETGIEGEITDAVQQGAEFVKNNIKASDSPEDITSAIIALNTVGLPAEDASGRDMTEWLIKYQRKDGSFSFDETAKKGNEKDTAMAMLGLASRYRYNTGMSSIYEMSDVLGGTHNKLSPEWQMNIKLMTGFIYMMICFLLGLLIVSRYRIWKWKKEGIWDYEKNRMMSDEDIAKVKRRKAAEAAQTEEKDAE